MASLVLVSCRDINKLIEYIEENEISKEYEIHQAYGNMHIKDLEKDVKKKLDDGKNYFIHTYSNDVIKMFAKYAKVENISFIRIEDEEVIEYYGADFIETVNGGWEVM